MIPKNRAKDIIDKMSKECDNADYSEIKFCAIICVKEILDVLYKLSIQCDEVDINYWRKVKREIEKL